MTDHPLRRRPSLLREWVRGPLTDSLYIAFAGMVGTLIFVGLRLLMYGGVLR